MSATVIHYRWDIVNLLTACQRTMTSQMGWSSDPHQVTCKCCYQSSLFVIVRARSVVVDSTGKVLKSVEKSWNERILSE